MKGYWVWGLIVSALAAGNMGCYYDQWQAAERSNRLLQESLSQVKQDLQDCTLMNRQKDTTIDGLQKQLGTRDEQVNSLMAESANLKGLAGTAADTLKRMADKNPGTVQIIKSEAVLPPALHADLEALAKQYPDQIEYMPDKGAVRWKADLLFPLGSDDMTQNDQVLEALSKFAAIIKRDAGGFDVIVVGHTCTTPIRRPETQSRFPTNWHLSAGRAIRIMMLLAGEGISETQMGVMGYGEWRPIADNSSNDGKARNRRVEIFLVKRGTVQSMSMNVQQVKDQDLAFVWSKDLSKTELLMPH